MSELLMDFKGIEVLKMNDKIDKGGSAFPDSQGNYDGMSLRDYFAGQAMHGLLSNGTFKNNSTDLEFAKDCYKLADIMIKARNN